MAVAAGPAGPAACAPPPRPRVITRRTTVGLQGDGDGFDIGHRAPFAITAPGAKAEATRTAFGLCDRVVARTGLAPAGTWPQVVRITRDISGGGAPIDRDTGVFATDADPRI